jgi:hypothetical protein
MKHSGGIGVRAPFHFAVLFAALTAFVAAEAVAQQFTVGAKLGFNVGWYGGRNWDDYIDDAEETYGISVQRGGYPALLAGVFAEYLLNEYTALAAELSYTSYGHSFEYTYASADVDEILWYDTVQVPLLLKLRFPTADGYYVYGVFGPSMQLLVSELENDAMGEGVSIAPGGTPDNMVLAGATGGLGYEFILKRGVLSIEARYATNLTYLFDDEDAHYAHHGIQMILGYGLRVK